MARHSAPSILNQLNLAQSQSDNEKQTNPKRVLKEKFNSDLCVYVFFFGVGGGIRACSAPVYSLSLVMWVHKITAAWQDTHTHTQAAPLAVVKRLNRLCACVCVCDGLRFAASSEGGGGDYDKSSGE